MGKRGPKPGTGGAPKRSNKVGMACWVNPEVRELFMGDGKSPGPKLDKLVSDQEVKKIIKICLAR